MKRKILLISIIALIFTFLTISCTFAAGNMVNDVRGFVGGAENAVEDAGNTIASTVKNGMNTIGNGASKAGNTIANGAHNVENTVGAVTTNNNNNGYSAQRTATNTNVAGGIGTTGWTWFIIAVTAIAIGVLIWSYVRENKYNNPYIDSNNK